MSLSFRQLYQEDFELYKAMETQLEEDYMLRVFDRLTSDGNALFGLFQDDMLIAVAGYTLFAGEFAMMGRLRSDSRYRKNGYGTLITEYIYNEAKRTSDIKWIGANTEKHNTAAQKVLQKLEVPHVTTLYAAQSEDFSALTSGDGTSNWHRVESVEVKRKWIEETYLNPDFDKAVFPLEAYYPFPASPSLFTDDRLSDWICYENSDSTRVVFMWEEEKGKKYLHVVYPWSDFMTQPGFFDVVSKEFEESKRTNEVSSVWMDLTEVEAALLPETHPFDLPSPWMLHGHFVNNQSEDDNSPIDNHAKTDEQSSDAALDESFNKASDLLADLEAEINELEQSVSGKQAELEQLQDRLDQMDSDI